MEQHLKITVIFLLLIQAFQISLLEDTTESPGRTIDKSWLRKTNISVAQSQSTADAEESSANGFMLSSSGDYTDVTNQDQSSQVTVTDTTMLPPFLNATTKEPQLPENTSNSTNLNETRTKDNSTMDILNSTTATSNITTPPTILSTTSFPHLTNNTTLPKTNETQTTTPGPGISSNGTEATNVTTTEAPKTSTATSFTIELSTETTVDEVIPVDLTTVNPGTPVKANISDKDTGGNSERGLGPDYKRNRGNEAWGAILGTAVCVIVVGLVVYVILKKRDQRGFSHRKLVEFSPDPVLRLDTNEPLDLNYEGSSYYNGGLQSDIQMTNFPERD